MILCVLYGFKGGAKIQKTPKTFLVFGVFVVLNKLNEWKSDRVEELKSDRVEGWKSGRGH